MIGKVIGDYKVVKKIGSGGMGDVYLARDQNLQRDVALKLLPEQMVGKQDQIDRFLREARSAAALQHPAILTIHQTGTANDGRPFIVMDYYPGRTLKELMAAGPIPEERALRLAVQIGDALACAHAANIVHRDIKPSNIMVSDNDEVKILDFGLAKVLNQAALTRTPVTMGTAAYMSPEQARGDPVDHRTDIWSLGVVLYEMVTGEQPFKGDFADALIYGILHRDIPALPRSCCSRKLRPIIQRMLAKNPADRPAHLPDLLHELAPLAGVSGSASYPLPFKARPRWRRILWPALAILTVMLGYGALRSLDSNGAPPRKSLAVLPFANLTGDAKMEAWSAGFPELILTELSRSPDLYVLNSQASECVYQAMGNPSIASFSPVQIKDFATRTRTGYLVLGSLLEAGDRWRIQVRLQDAQQGHLLTSISVETDQEDSFFAVADSVAGFLRDFMEIRHIEQTLSYGQRSYAAGTASADAYRKFLAAYEAYRKREWGMARTGFEQALEHDPEYTSAQYMLIWTYRQLGRSDQVQELFEVVQGKKDSLPIIDQYSLEVMGAILDKDHWAAIQALIKVLDRDPQLRGKWGQLGALYLSVRETELARQALEKAMDLTRQWGDRYPWVHLYRNLAQVLVEQGKYDQAIAAATMGLDTGEQNRRSMLFWICAANLARGDQEQAEAQLALFEEELHRKGMADILVSMNVGLIYKKAGCTEGVLPRMEAAVAAEPTFFPAVSWLAALQDDAGRPEAAVACLDSFLAHDPEHPEAHMQLALIRAANDLDLDEAVSRLELMRSSHPELVNPEFLRVLGAAYLRQDRSQLAVRTLEEAWDLLPQYDHETYLTLQAARKAAEGAAL